MGVFPMLVPGTNCYVPSVLSCTWQSAVDNTLIVILANPTATDQTVQVIWQKDGGGRNVTVEVKAFTVNTVDEVATKYS